MSVLAARNTGPTAPNELTRHMMVYGPLAAGIAVLAGAIIWLTAGLTWHYPGWALAGTITEAIAFVGTVAIAFIRPTATLASTPARDIWFAEWAYVDRNGHYIPQDELRGLVRNMSTVTQWRDIRPTFVMLAGMLAGVGLLLALAGIGYFANPM